MLPVRRIVSIVTAATTTAVVLVAPSAVAAPTSDVVRPDRLGQDWHVADTRATASLAFVTDVGGVLGSGAAVLATADGTGKVQLLSDAWSGTRLADITELGYSTLRIEPLSGTTALPALNLRADMNADGHVDAYLVYEPYLSDPDRAKEAGWQTWDALEGGTAQWWSTDSTSPCYRGKGCTWDDLFSGTTTQDARILEDPDSPINSSAAPTDELHGSIGVNQGSGNAGLIAAVDALHVATADRSDTYDFEPAEPPTVEALVGTGVAGTPGVPVVLDPGATVGTGPFTYELTEHPAWGSARIDQQTGEITFVPDAGASGLATFAYRATDRDGLAGPAAPVVIAIAPSPATTPTVETTATTDGGTAVRFDVAEPSGTAPFTYGLGAPDPAGSGTASIDAGTGQITFSPAAGFSGPVTLPYVVTDASGVPADGTVSITVRPVATAPPTVPAPRTADRSLSFDLPAPVGRGPFVYRLVDGPSAAQGSVTIDAGTGRVTIVPDPGYTGTIAFSYTATDGAGLTSAPMTVQVPTAAADAPAGRSTSSERRELAATGSTAGLLGGLAALLVVTGAGLSALPRRVREH